MNMLKNIFSIVSENLNGSPTVKYHKERNSNIELLRLICMFMILIHHFITHCFYGMEFVFYGQGEITFTSGFAIMLNGFCYVGVNCFLLITGYFGLRFKWKTLLNLYLIMVFYSVVYDIFDMYMWGELFPFKYFLDNILTMSGFSRWWFMECYVIFFFIAPLIKNDGWSKIQYQKIIILLTIVNVYLAYWQNRYSNGYTVAQFLYMYIVGGYIRRYITVNKENRLLMFLLYIVPAFLFGLISVICHYKYLPHWESLSYNNPLNILSAIGMFCFLLSFEFHNKFVNIIAASALSVYLVQNYAFMKYVTNYLSALFPTYDNVFCFLIVTLFLSFVLFVLAIFLDQVRLLLFAPIIRNISFHSSKCQN